MFYFPKKFIKQVEALCRNYLWSGTMMRKNAPISWDSVCLPKSGGTQYYFLVGLEQSIDGKIFVEHPKQG